MIDRGALRGHFFAPMFEGARIAVVVPARDEARLIGRTLASIPTFVDRIVVVDDGSTDGTAERAQAVGDPRVEVLRHDRTVGVGAAIARGYAHAFAAGCEVAAVMAGDAQMDPADLPALLGPVARGECGYAKGDRLSWPGARTLMPRVRWAGGHAFSWLTSLATGVYVRDSQCGFTALSRDASQRIDLDGLWSGYGYPNDLIGRVARAGIRVQNVPVRPVYADERSGLRLRHGLVVIPFVITRVLAARIGQALRPTPAALPNSV